MSERLATLRVLVRDALHDTSTYEDDGPWGDVRERPMSSQHAFSVRRLLAGRALDDAEADVLAQALREGADRARTVALLVELRNGIPNDARWRTIWSGLVGDPDPRVRLLVLAADFLYTSHFLEDPDEEVRLEALRVLSGHLRGDDSAPLVRARLADPSPRVRAMAVGLVHVVPEWRDALATARQDPDERVRAAVADAERFAKECEAASARAAEARDAARRAQAEKRAKQQAAQRKDRSRR